MPETSTVPCRPVSSSEYPTFCGLHNLGLIHRLAGVRGLSNCTMSERGKTLCLCRLDREELSLVAPLCSSSTPFYVHSCCFPPRLGLVKNRGRRGYNSADSCATIYRVSFTENYVQSTPFIIWCYCWNVRWFLRRRGSLDDRYTQCYKVAVVVYIGCYLKLESRLLFLVTWKHLVLVARARWSVRNSIFGRLPYRFGPVRERSRRVLGHMYVHVPRCLYSLALSLSCTSELLLFATWHTAVTHSESQHKCWAARIVTTPSIARCWCWPRSVLRRCCQTAQIFWKISRLYHTHSIARSIFYGVLLVVERGGSVPTALRALA